jgi:hypothetical protein
MRVPFLLFTLSEYIKSSRLQTIEKGLLSEQPHWSWRSTDINYCFIFNSITFVIKSISHSLPALLPPAVFIVHIPVETPRSSSPAAAASSSYSPHAPAPRGDPRGPLVRVCPPVCFAPLGLPNVSVAELDPQRVVAHKRGPVLVDFALVEPPDLKGDMFHVLLQGRVERKLSEERMLVTLGNSICIHLHRLSQ